MTTKVNRKHAIRRFISEFFFTVWDWIYPTECKVDGCCYTKLTEGMKFD